MPSRHTTDARPHGRPARGEAGALRRARLRGRAVTGRSRTAALLLCWALLASAHAGPNPFGVHAPCPDAILPMRMATFQAPRGDSIDVASWIDLDEFKESRPWVTVGRGANEITVVVFAYVGSLAESMAFEVTGPDGTVTWRTDVALDPPDAGTTSMMFYPYYALVRVPTRSWGSIFPVAGPYLLRAWRPGPPSTYVDAFCGAESTSWVIVLH
jgi:hypothetical protein